MNWRRSHSRHSRAQASLEYLVTYGWVFIIILTTIGALSYFGVINPSRWLPDKCDFGQQLVCIDYSAQAGAGTLSLYVRNNFGKQIDITSANITVNQRTTGSLLAVQSAINPGETREIVISGIAPATLIKKTKMQMTIAMTFQRTSTTNVHELKGLLFTTIKP